MPIMTMGRFGCSCGPFWLYDGPFWTMQWAVLDNFLEIKIFGAVLAMGRFGIDPFQLSVYTYHPTAVPTICQHIPPLCHSNYLSTHVTPLLLPEAELGRLSNF